MIFRLVVLPALLAALFVTLLVFAPDGVAQDGGDNRVALVVDYGNGQMAERCVSFSEESITGYEALLRSGLPVETDFQTGGAAVCRIDAQGCPADDCFCSCRGGGECQYWSYWHLIDGEWRYAAGGSAIYQVSHGTVEGWSWGLASVSQAVPPPVVSFADVCGVSAVSSTAAPATPVAAGPERFDFVPYAGFAGLLLFIGLMALVVYQRRRATFRSDNGS